MPRADIVHPQGDKRHAWLHLIDTHAHLCDPAFQTDLGDVLRRASDVGIHAVVSVSENLSDCERNLELSGLHPGFLHMAGLAPSGADLRSAEEIIVFIRRERARLRGIGEVGLDYWVAKEEPERELQREVFSAFIDLAKELDLPLNVHSRSAGRQTVELLLKRGAGKVQLHAFDGKASAALPAVEAGYFFSIPPSVVRSEQKQKLVRSLPLHALLLETDSPVLGPVREERNEPANALISLDAIAEIKGIPRDEVAEALSRNGAGLYDLGKDDS